jgi:hypothetical protein
MKELKEIRALPVVVSYGIWLARNSEMFQGKVVPSFQCASKIRQIFNKILFQFAVLSHKPMSQPMVHLSVLHSCFFMQHLSCISSLQ